MPTVSLLRSAGKLLASMAAACSLLSTPSSAATDLPRTVEVDLLFPQPNTTYAPAPVFPIVFAIQNPDLLRPLRAGLYITMRSYPGLNYTTAFYPLDIDISTIDTNSSETVFPWSYVAQAQIPDGHDEASFVVTWQFSTENCSDSTSDSYEDRYEYHSDRAKGWSHSSLFTLARGAPAINATAAATKPECKSAQGFAFDVADVKGVQNWGGCAVFDEDHPFPEPNPCGATLSDELAANITQEIAHLNCLHSHDDVDVCSGAAATSYATMAASAIAASALIFSVVQHTI